MQIDVQKLKNAITKATVIFPDDVVKETEEEVLVALGGDLEVKGFRKGSVPTTIVREHIPGDKLLEEVVHKLLPSAMQQIVAEHDPRPIARPRVELTIPSPLTIVVTMIGQPSVKMKGTGKIGKEAKKRREEEKKKEKKGEGEGQPTSRPAGSSSSSKLLGDKSADKGEKGNNEEKVASAEEEKKKIEIRERMERDRTERHVFDLIAENVTVDLASELIDDETRSMLEEQAERLKQAGLEMDAWLAQIGKTFEVFLQEVRTAAEKRLRIRFGVQHLIEEKELSVDEEEMRRSIDSFLMQIPEEYRSQLAPLYEKGARNYEQFKSQKLVEKLVEALLG